MGCASYASLSEERGGCSLLGQPCGVSFASQPGQAGCHLQSPPGPRAGLRVVVCSRTRADEVRTEGVVPTRSMELGEGLRAAAALRSSNKPNKWEKEKKHDKGPQYSGSDFPAMGKQQAEAFPSFPALGTKDTIDAVGLSCWGVPGMHGAAGRGTRKTSAGMSAVRHGNVMG